MLPLTYPAGIYCLSLYKSFTAALCVVSLTSTPLLWFPRPGLLALCSPDPLLGFFVFVFCLKNRVSVLCVWCPQGLGEGMASPGTGLML